MIFVSFLQNSELITPGNNAQTYNRVSSARGPRKNPYVPIAEETREDSSEEEASWI